jgi:hypothetical protein
VDSRAVLDAVVKRKIPSPRQHLCAHKRAHIYMNFRCFVDFNLSLLQLRKYIRGTIWNNFFTLLKLFFPGKN